ncbi:MAG TPA: ATP-binding protein [Rhodocyclaceae bacterium]
MKIFGGYSPPESFWRSLHYFHAYRLLVAALFVVALVWLPQLVPFGGQNIDLAQWVTRAYLLAALIFFVLLRGWRPDFNLLLSIEVAFDVVCLTLLMNASGGSRSGFSYMLLVVVAGAGLVGQGRLTLFYAAMASVAVLLEQGHRMLSEGADLGDFTHVGIVSIGFFATAISARLLSKRVVANEELARARGVALENQLRINEQVIRDMQDGVLVVDRQGRVRQFNPPAEAICGGRIPPNPLLADFDPVLAARLDQWLGTGETEEVLRLQRSHRTLRVRYLPSGEGDSALVYLEDPERVQQQARQLKLAALGRLTANMAHEIRNPLAAISHAAELLKEGDDVAVHQRLVRIIGDNTQRLNRLVNDVLEVGRRDRAHQELIPLRSVAEALMDGIALVDPLARATVSIEIPEGLSVLFDRGHLDRILANLLGNALGHCSGSPGSVRLIAVLASSGRGIALEVSDDGPGIPSAQRAQVFEPFFTTRATGTGLGLYIARELAEANGAVLDLIDCAEGACFRLTIRLEGSGSGA